MPNGPAQVSRKESADKLRAHYERIWQKGGEGWTSTVNLAAKAWEREPELVRENTELRVKVEELEEELRRAERLLSLNSLSDDEMEVALKLWQAALSSKAKLETRSEEEEG